MADLLTLHSLRRRRRVIRDWVDVGFPFAEKSE